MRGFCRLGLGAWFLLLTMLPGVTVACLWDYDTLKMERSRFPNALELITGKFLRHSPEFYQWRIDDRLIRLESDPTNPALLDDLAVAYDKLGEHQKAIETALKIEQSHPGRYETASNLATFYFHAGTPELGLPYLEQALAINPEAHFGREKYQLALTEYVLQQWEESHGQLPVGRCHWADMSKPVPDSRDERTFAKHLRTQSFEHLASAENQAAVKGVLGMMRFANHESPILLEALGSLLLEGHRSDDAKFLAARAYLKASYESPDDPTRAAYREMAGQALSMQTQGALNREVSLAQVESDFQQELADADAWYTQLRDKELAWIRDGNNPEVEFDQLYAAETPAQVVDLQGSKTMLAALLGVVIFAALLFAWQLRRRSSSARATMGS
ncbi:MAG: hypothetical protein KF708_18690 [Pirellulales bacterium]|nr:hypothetical protein [Pirellulales bacterium]